MDEFWSRKLMRRLALLAVVNSVAIPAAATELQNVSNQHQGAANVQIPAEKTQVNLRSLLKAGNQAKNTVVNRHISDQGSPEQPQGEQTQTSSAKPQDSLRSFLSQGWDTGNRYSVTIQSRKDEKPKPTKAQAKLPQQKKSTQTTVIRPNPEPSTAVEPAIDEKQLQRLDGERRSAGLADLLKKAPNFSKAAKSALKASIAKRTDAPSQKGLVEQSLETPRLDGRQTELLRDTVKQNGFGLLATDEITAPAPTEASQPETLSIPEPPSDEMLHATRLRGVAQGLLREAFHALRRDSSYTAKKKTTAALRSIIAMRDAIDGGNQHSREFAAALDAIRESRDFGAGIQAVDHEQLKRLVTVHKTEVLKKKSLSEMSSLGATTAYLEFAREKLVAALGSYHEASYALQLLGKIEQRLMDALDSHGAAIALTYQRAAIEVDPSNAIAHYELGRTYSGHGLTQQAQMAFAKSIELNPTRGGYENLLAAARKLGNIDTVRRCKHALADSSLPSDIPVYELEPEVFAATYRPNHNDFKSAPIKQAKAHGPQPQQAAPAQHLKQTKTSSKASSEVTAMTRLRSLFSLDR